MAASVEKAISPRYRRFESADQSPLVAFHTAVPRPERNWKNREILALSKPIRKGTFAALHTSVLRACQTNSDLALIRQSLRPTIPFLAGRAAAREQIQLYIQPDFQCKP